MNFIKTILFCTCFVSFGAICQTDITIPNVITPNNDGTNDVFQITSSGYDELTCTIINRYGEVVYRFYGLNGTWDGYSHAGIKVAAGVYFVFLEASTTDGVSETKQGTVEVLY